jgi:hypothetical protein
MTAQIIPFPRPPFAVRVTREDEGGWLVLVGSHGWLHGDEDGAREDARWLAANYGVPVRAGRRRT